MNLRKIISIELQKTLSYISFWIIIGIMLGLYILFTFSVPFFELSILGSSFDVSNYFEFPIIWNTTTWIASFFNHLLAILIIILIGNEFNFRTFKQNLIDGLTKNEIIVGKMSLIVLFSLSYVIIVNIITFILGAIYSDSGSSMIFNGYYYNLLLFLQTFGLMTFGMMIVFYLKNTALSIIVYIGYFIFEAISRFILFLNNVDITKYFPMKIILNLTHRPALNTAFNDEQMAEMVENTENTFATLDMSIISILSIIYVSIFILLTFYKVRKQNF